MMNEIRLQKYLASCGIASRRKSEELIKEGKIKVNGEIITQIGFCINENDLIEYNGKKITPSEKIYIILNKPPGFVCSREDYLKGPTIYDIVDDRKKSIFSVGRLDFNSCGILILTNDGDFAQSLSHPSNSIIKTYNVNSYKDIPDKLIKNFKNGIMINDIKYTACEIKRILKNEIEIKLLEGKKREIREVFKSFGLKIKRLERVSIGMLNLCDINLNLGDFKYLSLNELERKIYGKEHNNCDRWTCRRR